MANSSDWVALLQGEPPEKRENSNWIESLMEPRGFIEGLPQSRPAPPLPDVAAPPPVEEDRTPDPVEDAYLRGVAQGRAESEGESAVEREQQRLLRLNFRTLDQTALDCLAGELAQTVLTLCEQAFADFVPDAEALKDRCEQAAKRIGAAPNDCALHLHPDDLAQLDPEWRQHWRIVEDQSVGRGGLRFEGQDGAISDSPADWQRAVAAALQA